MIGGRAIRRNLVGVLAVGAVGFVVGCGTSDAPPSGGNVQASSGGSSGGGSSGGATSSGGGSGGGATSSGGGSSGGATSSGGSSGSGSGSAQDASIGSDAASDSSAPSPDADTTPDAGSPDVGTPPQHVNLLAFGDGDPDQHGPYVDAALMWLDQQMAAGSLSYTYINGAPDTFTDSLLAQYDVIWQLNYPPFGWTDTAKAAFQKYLTDGIGGWVGVHHASLYGPEVQPAGEVPWQWCDDNLLGSINFVNYIASFAAGTVHVEDTSHPIFNGVPSTFLISKEEWYTWDKSPRPNVHVLANVDENSYMPPSNITMGDHPVIWTNPNLKGKNVYIFMGHDPVLFDSTDYKTLLRNALFWAATK